MTEREWLYASALLWLKNQYSANRAISKQTIRRIDDVLSTLGTPTERCMLDFHQKFPYDNYKEVKRGRRG